MDPVKLEKDPLNKGLIQTTKSRIEVLNEMGEDELRDIYKYEFGGVEAPDDYSEEQLRAAINGAAPYAPAPTRTPDPIDKKGTFEVSSKDTGKKYTVDAGSKGKVIVRQVNIRDVEGNIVELPNSEVIQTYEPDMFQRLLDQKFFAESKIHVEVLHGGSKK